MRVISGSARGTKLNSIDSLSTRPTLDRVKEPLFSILNFRLDNAIVLDLFSGSGALGLESISRGANQAYLCDKSREEINIIKKNVEKTREKEKVEIVFKNYTSALQEFVIKNIKFDIVFLDPPYETDFAKTATEIILNNNLLNKDGIIVIETDNKEKVINSLKDINVKIYDERKYGRVTLLFLCKEERK